jgi:hypothetical protein
VAAFVLPLRATAVLCLTLFRRRALAVPASLLFAKYLLDTLGRVSEDLEGLQPLSAFCYADPP